MIELLDWARRAGLPAKPWLMLGKGPTFSKRGEFDLGRFNLMGLNHVVKEQPVDVAHVIDIDVVAALGNHLADNTKWLLMPRVPHVHMRASLRRLEDFVPTIPVLRRLDDEGRLVWYDADTSPSVGGSPVIEVKYFSSTAALSILATIGAKTVRTLGIDGGTAYSAVFASLAATTRLANGLPSFDVQFIELERIARTHGVDFQPLVEPLRIYIGAGEGDMVAARVLEHTIRKHATVPVRVTPMVNVPVPLPRSRQNRPRTAFSFSRFLIPMLAGYRGRAIYMDSDMLVFGDVSELAELPFGDAVVLCTRQDETPAEWRGSSWFKPGRQFSVMVLDCDRLDWDIERLVNDLDAGRLRYQDLLFDLAIVPPEQVSDSVRPEWNHLEHYEPTRTKLLHYTVGDRQPWRIDGNPLEHLWLEAYREAVAAGAIVPAEVERLVAMGLVKRSLLDALSAAPRPPGPVYASYVDVELEAAQRRIEELERRSVRWKARAVARAGAPLLRRARAARPESVATKALQRTADGIRRRWR